MLRKEWEIKIIIDNKAIKGDKTRIYKNREA